MYAVYVIFIFVFKVCYGWQYKDGKLFYANCTQDKEKNVFIYNKEMRFDIKIARMEKFIL